LREIDHQTVEGKSKPFGKSMFGVIIGSQIVGPVFFENLNGDRYSALIVTDLTRKFSSAITPEHVVPTRCMSHTS